MASTNQILYGESDLRRKDPSDYSQMVVGTNVEGLQYVEVLRRLNGGGRGVPGDIEFSVYFSLL